jgi:alkyl hydroperoxide reductase subunit AhpF
MKSFALTEEIPVKESVDVLVVGGGPAGFSAAFAAARRGAKTRSSSFQLPGASPRRRPRHI